MNRMLVSLLGLAPAAGSAARTLRRGAFMSRES